MSNLQLHDLGSEKRVITLYEICKVLGKRHNDAIKMVDELHQNKDFGNYEIFVIEPERGGKSINTFSYTKKQALMIGARLDSKNIILLVNKLEELSKPKTYEEIMREALLLADKKVRELENKIEADKPKVLFAENVSASLDSLLIREWVKSISTDEVKIGQNKAFEWLRYNGYLMKNNEPYQKHINNGYFEVIERTSATPSGVKIFKTTKITGRGQVALANKIFDYFSNN